MGIAVIAVSWMWRRGGRPQSWRLRPAPTPSPPAWQAAASLDSLARQLQPWVALAAVPLVASVVDAVAPGLPVLPLPVEAMGRPPMPLPAVDVARGRRCLVGPLPHWRGKRRRWAPYLGLFGRAPAPPKTAPAPAPLVERLLWWSWSRFTKRLAKQLHADFH
jgi:hypothetical protein